MRKLKWCFMAILILTGLMLGGCAWLFPPPIQAVLVATPTSGPAPLSVTFSAAQSTGPITSFTLDFGDGSPPYSGTNITVSISHTYVNPRTYTATLTVQDALGRTNSATVSITVTALPTTKVTLGAIPASGPAPLDVLFWVTINAAPGRKIVHLRLKFDDGSPDYEAAVDLVTYNAWLTGHSYAAPGTYTATLTATDNTGQATSASVTITVTDPLPKILSFTAAPQTGGPPPLNVNFNFTARAGGTGRKIVKYTLSFGDTASLTEDGLNISHPATLSRTIPHSYTRPGTYTATLKVWDDQNQTDEESLQIVVTP